MISAATRRTVRTIYAFACGYCGVSETDVGAHLTIDHFIPVEVGGMDDIENLVYACPACNQYKSASWNLVEPLVLHPLRDDVSLHTLLVSDGTLQALTEEGQRHIATLHLNRVPLVERRKTKMLFEAVLRGEVERLAREAQLDADTRSKSRRIRHKGRRKQV